MDKSPSPTSMVQSILNHTSRSSSPNK
uniref:Uncharacterized protein n=1 Tax=Rhizophora mucronata TaxID=61149 RepID=A0A2P2NSQ0_RHIMU